MMRCILSRYVSEASEIFDNIADSLESKIMEVASNLPSLEELISADLVKKHQSNTDVTAKRLVCLLQEAGFVNGDIVLSSDVKQYHRCIGSLPGRVYAVLSS